MEFSFLHEKGGLAILSITIKNALKPAIMQWPLIPRIQFVTQRAKKVHRNQFVKKKKACRNNADEVSNAQYINE